MILMSPSKAFENLGYQVKMIMVYQVFQHPRQANNQEQGRKIATPRSSNPENCICIIWMRIRLRSPNGATSVLKASRWEPWRIMGDRITRKNRKLEPICERKAEYILLLRCVGQELERRNCITARSTADWRKLNLLFEPLAVIRGFWRELDVIDYTSRD